EADARERPDPFTADAIGQITQTDLASDAREADQPERPGGETRLKADVDQVFRLMHLDGVPGEEPAEKAERDPPEARGADGAGERPIGGRPRRIHDVRGMRARGGISDRHVAVGTESEIFRPAAL